MKPRHTIPLVSLSMAAALACVIPAQTAERFYAFKERKPRTKLEKTIAEVMPSLVKVHGASGLKTIQSYATGVIVSDQGHVLTLDQILVQEERTKVVLHDGTVCKVDVMPAEEKLGVRMLKITDEDFKKIKSKLVPLQPAVKQDHRNGTFLMSIGNAYRLAEFSEKLSVMFGVVTGRVRTGLRYRLAEVDYDGELIITDAANNPGHYGGGLFTLEGEWIGMNTRVVESTETNSQVSAAIPTGDLRPYIKRCVEQGMAGAAAPTAAKQIVPVYHGIRLFDHGRRVSPPAYVERVRRDSPGRKAGLRPDDLIVKIDRHVVRTCKDFRRVLENFKPGEEVLITYKRGSKVRQTKLTFAEER